MCGNPFKTPKIPDTPTPLPAPAPVPAAVAQAVEPQLAPEIKSAESERDVVKARKRGRRGLRIDLDGAVPGGTGLSIPTA